MDIFFNVFRFSYEAPFSFIQTLQLFFIFSFRYLDYVEMLNNLKFCDHVKRIYFNELEMEDIADKINIPQVIEN